MIHVVFDTSVVASAIFWPRSTARRALTLVARRQVRSCVTEPIEREYRNTCLQLQRSRFPERSPLRFLGWLSSKSLHCLPAPLGKQRSRDPSDDPFLACALAAQAQFVLSSDRDLLSLQKPFGIAIVTPSRFIHSIEQPPG